MKRLVTLTIAISAFTGLQAQPNSTVPKNLRAASTLEQLFDGNGLSNSEMLYGIPLEPGAVIGSAYLDDLWKRTTFVLYDTDKMIEGYSARYAVDENLFEIKTSAGVKVLNGKRVRSFVWMEEQTQTPQYFVNAREYKDEAGAPFPGFLEVLIEGPYTLVRHTTIAVRQPSYNEKLDVGNRDTRIVRKEKLYFLEGDVVREVPRSRKKMLGLFGEHAEAIDMFIKKNNLSAGNDHHVRLVFEKYNQLTTG